MNSCEAFLADAFCLGELLGEIENDFSTYSFHAFTFRRIFMKNRVLCGVFPDKSFFLPD